MPDARAALGDRGFRFGVSVRSAASRAEWIDKARRVETLGYDTFLVADHLADMLPPLVPLLSVAEATGLRIGTLVLNNDLRHPALVARDAATIDVLSDGRFELGIGAGHMQAEYEQIGFDFDAASRRIERLAESVHIVKALFAGEAVSFIGEHYRLTEHRLYPLPVQRPHPPLLIGSNSREGLSLAAREADIVGLMGFGHRQGGRRINPSGFTDAATRERIEWIREAAGSHFANLELNVLVQQVIVTDHAVDAAAEFVARSASLREAGLSAEDLLSSPFILIGSVDELVDEIRARRERLGISYLVVFEKDMEAFGPLLGRLTAASA